MNKILRSLRKKFPNAKFEYVGFVDSKAQVQGYHRIVCNKFVMMDEKFLIRCNRLTKQLKIDFLISYSVK